MTSPSSSVCLVIPCFNEAARLRTDDFIGLAGESRLSILFVDDHSTDSTLSLLRSLTDNNPRMAVLALDRNGGKGEAIRAGIRQARRGDADWIGYLDADLATPPNELLRLVDVGATNSELHVVLASRVAMLGRDVRRSAFRHYTGRCFATFASIVLDKPVYDTQCGAKLFRAGPTLDTAISEPFRSRWAFDVELLGRLALAGVPASAFWEEPLREWHDVPGSKRSVWASVRATADLWSIRNDLRRWPSR